tara:strand:- start:2523 stop:3245 length:723 start_codon:yes stop_codon:yes gene_type:complete
MSLPDSGKITMNDIHIALGGEAGTECSLNDDDFRSLGGKPNNQSEIQMSDFHGAALVREIPSYFYSSSAKTDSFNMYNGQETFVNPQTNKKNLLILINHVDIWWDHWGTIALDYQDGETGSLLPTWGSHLGYARTQSLGYWRGNGHTHISAGGSNKAVILSNEGDYTLDIEKVIGGVRHRADLRDSNHQMWPGVSYRRMSSGAYPNSWAIWVENRYVNRVFIRHSGNRWGGFKNVVLRWQ